MVLYNPKISDQTTCAVMHCPESIIQKNKIRPMKSSLNLLNKNDATLINFICDLIEIPESIPVG